MKFNLTVKQEATTDMAEAFDWYENQRSGLGSQFLDEIEQYFDKISKAPKHYQKHGDLHVAVMNRFPFKIVYEIEDKAIVVYAVFHSKRNPKVLLKRKK